jgi:hypothetical protein
MTSITLQTNSGNTIFQQRNNETNQTIIKIQDSNGFRKFRNCWEMIGDAFNSLKSGIKTRLGITCYTGNKDLALLSRVDSAYGNTIAAKLKHQTQLDPFATNKNLDHIKENNSDSQVVQTYFSQGHGSLPKKNQNVNNIMIPIVLAGFERHIVAVYIYFENGKAKIEFYDPKGLTIADRGNNRLAYMNLNLPQAIANIVSTYCNDVPNVTIVENTFKDQNDSHNCGIHVLNYFEQRLKGFEPHEISSDFHTFDRSFAVRTRIIDNLIEDYTRDQSSAKGISFMSKDQNIDRLIQQFGIAHLLKFMGREWLKDKIRNRNIGSLIEETGKQCLIKEKGEEWLAKNKMRLVNEYGKECLIKEKGEEWVAKNKASLKGYPQEWFVQIESHLLRKSGEHWLNNQPNKDALIKRRGIVWLEQNKNQLINEQCKQGVASTQLIRQKGIEWLQYNRVIY